MLIRRESRGDVCVIRAVTDAASGRPERAHGGAARRSGYYHRFGFRLGSDYQVTPPVARWQPYFQVRPLACYRCDSSGLPRYLPPLRSRRAYCAYSVGVVVKVRPAGVFHFRTPGSG